MFIAALFTIARTWRKWFFDYFKFRREDKRVSSVSGKTTALSLSWPMPGLSGKESWKERVKGSFCSILFPRSGAWCVMHAWEAVAGQETCSDDGGKWNWDGLKWSVGGFGQTEEQKQWSPWREFEGLEIRATREGEALSLSPDSGGSEGGWNACRCWRWPRLSAFRPGKGEDAQMVTFLPGNAQPCSWMGTPSTAVQISWSPRSLGGPSARKGWCHRPLLTPSGTPSSLALVSALCVCVCVCVCVYTCVRETRQMWCWSFVWVHWRNGLRTKDTIVKQNITGHHWWEMRTVHSSN